MDVENIRRWIAVVAASFLLAAVAAAPPAGATSPGLDISWPQCPGLAVGAAGGFSVVGLTNGLAYTDNPCLATEWRWASSTGTPAGLYLVLNSGPFGGTDAAYAYGAGAIDHALATMASTSITAPLIWLDVETGKFWSADQAANAAVVHGAIDRLHARGLGAGIYSTAYQWAVIAGADRPGGPIWVAGTPGYAGVQSYCSSAHAFAGGQPWIVQLPPSPLDVDVLCPAGEAGLGSMFHVGPSVDPPMTLAISGAPYWRGWDIARGVAFAAGGGGVEVDGYGGLHPFSTGGARPANVTSAPYWKGWDIARGLALVPTGGGYVVDGWGGLHPFAQAGTTMPPPVATSVYWPGWDVARGVALMPDGRSGYVLDGWGGLHPFATAGASMPPNVHGAPYWPGWDIARGITILADGSGGYIVDARGGLHPFSIGTGRAPPAVQGRYWAAALVRGAGVVADGTVLTLDGWGGFHTALPVN
ncbi:MAG: hypothetical protein JWO37_1899 [Acidimicrobiales bacterium]|nr:hypothetical protein [Acidimicrobiales bacterium]